MNLNDFFNPQLPKLEEDRVSNDFRPNAKKGKGGVYSALIRFLPNPSDPVNKSIIQKRVVYLRNPITQQGQYIDMPSSVGQPDPILDTFFALRNSGDAVKVENSKHFSSSQRYSSLIQVITSDSEPNLVNKILVWTYGKKIYDKIVEEMEPQYGTPQNPFDMIHGRPFIVKIVQQGDFNNYDQCKFVDLHDASSLVKINYQDKWVPVSEELIKNQKGQELVFNYLKDNCPDMSSYEYHDWDEATQTFVSTVINYYVNGNPMSYSQSANALNNGINPAAHPQQAAKSHQKQGLSLDGVLNGISSQQEGPTLGENVNQEQPKGSFNASDLNVPGLDDILNTSTPQASSNHGSEDGPSLDDILNSRIV